MRILVACEMSGRVREAFRSKGHDAWSCDLLPSLDQSPFHIVGDVLRLLESDPNWDCLIGHPPCTYLCNSGVRWLRKKITPTDWNGLQEWTINQERWDWMEQAREFFLSLLNAPIPKVCIENPIPHRYANLPPYSQTVQPYMFGDNASKRTCLWLRGLDPLEIPSQEKWAQPRIVCGHKVYGNQVWIAKSNKVGPKESPGPNRGLLRSLTWPGLARAMSERWS